MILFIATFIFYLILLIVSIANFITKPILKESKNSHDDFISILIPARNEENNIANILDSINAQDYKNYEVIVLNDGSTDRTVDIVKIYSEKNTKIKLINGKELPEKWLGKNWACHQLSENAKGKYLLFLDADTFVESGLISNSIDFIKKHNLQLLSIFPDQIMQSFGERLTVPLMNNILLSLLPLILIRKSKYPSLSAANGQFMFFKTENYLNNKWHERAKSEITEDITIVRLMKKSGFNCATLLGNGFIKCRMYKNFNEGVDGFSKNIILMLGNNLLFFITYVFFMSWALLILVLNPVYLLSILAIVVTIRIVISIISGQSLFYNIIFYPFQLITLNIISFFAIYRKINKSNVWKERKLNLS